ncbi:MAG: glycosyltransferase family 4 protein [Chlamydiae bacterium]|nr:glycosyltransferase family 4 protein [Chlamydiota bacterium]MBI3266510.1 glycosyltransferase family 4 protein [Chlamydiota bacterium]
MNFVKPASRAVNKVLFIYFRYPLYPSGSYFQEFLGSLSRSVREVFLIASRFPNSPFEKPKNLKIFWVPFFTFRLVEDILFMLFALCRVIFSRPLHHVDVVNSIGPRGLLAGWYLKRIYGVPLVCTIEMLNESGSWLDRLHYRCVRFLMKKVPIDRVICWSEYYWNSHIKSWNLSEDKMVIIPGGINTDVYHPGVKGDQIKEKYAANHPFIVFAKPLYFPNSESAKLLVRSIALLKPKIKVKLLLGSGWGRKEVEALAEDLQVLNEVEFMPFTSFTEIPQYIAASDLIVLPFTYAVTTSRSLFEAMAMGKPVITTNMGEIQHMLKNGEEAILVSPEAGQIAKAIECLLADPVLAQSLGRRASTLVREQYSLSSTVEKTIRLFSSLRS